MTCGLFVSNRIEVEIEAEYREKLVALELAHKDAEGKLLAQQSEYESKLKVHES